MSEDRARDLIAGLRNFRIRSEAADELVSMGEGAVGPLLEALEGEAHQGAKWAMLNCLGELGARRAVPALASYLDHSDYQTVAHDALVRITGRDMGPLARDWLRWLREEEGVEPEAPEAPAGPLDDDRLVELALEGAGAECRRERHDLFAVDVPLGGGGTQQVNLSFGAKDHEGSPIVIVYAICCEARPEHYETVLRNNLRMPYGAVAIRDMGGRPHFVMFNTILRKGLSPVELRKSILTVGERSDRIEKQLRQ